MRGYTLVELVVSITIMAILAAITVPLFNQSQVDSTWFREQVKSAVRYAQRQAVAQRRPVFVVVGTSSVALCYDAACASSSHGDSCTNAVAITLCPFQLDTQPVILITAIVT